MSYTEEELDKQESEVKRHLALVFIPILIFLVGYYFYLNHSLDYLKKQYDDSHNTAFDGKIIKKKENGTYPRADRYIILEDHHVQRIDQNTYQKVSLGDQVTKKKGHDSIFFYLKTGERIIIEVSKFERERYFKLLNKKSD